MKSNGDFPLSTALKKTLKGYNFNTFTHDLLAALVVSLLALPLCMALSIAVGLPPQHGIYTAIVAGTIVPLLGGSVSQVSGPTAAFVVILAPIVSELGLRGIIWCSIIAGILLIIFGFMRLGRLINYVPYPVTTGFTAGIAVVLATLSLNDFLGLGIEHLQGSYIEKATQIIMHLPNININEFAVGSITLLLLFFSGKVIKLPSALVAMIFGTALAVLLLHFGFDIQTIGSRFSYMAHDGSVIAGIPPYPPSFSLPNFTGDGVFAIPDLAEFRRLLFPSIAIAILAALESLLSATVADSMAHTKHDPNAELTAIGIGNIFSALASGIPATGAIARTATAINNGAQTPLASSMHALLIMVYVLLLAPYISYVPMAALAALLIHTAYSMSHHKQFINTIKIAHKSDVIVLLICFILTVFVDMVAGVGVGMICAAFLLINRVTELTDIKLDTNGENSISKNIPENTIVYRIRGPLFFGTVEKVFNKYNFTHDYINIFIIDISDVPFIDMSGLIAMKSMLNSIASEKRVVHVICNIPEVSEVIKKHIAGAEKMFIHFHHRIDEALGDIKEN
jgi:SulP family sulfate permease